MARIARHPVFLTGTAFAVLATTMTVQDLRKSGTGEALGMPVVALGVGLFAMLAAHQLTRSFDGANELVEAAPTSRVGRTWALCLSALVPSTVAAAWLVLHGYAQRGLWTTPEWMLGTLSHADVWAVIIGNTVVAALGGTLLGIAAGRWWHFRGSGAALVLGVAVWTIGLGGAFSSEGVPAAWTRWVRLFAPFNTFSNPGAHGAGPDDDGIYTLTGSPWWYLVWLLTLCALAAIAALLKGSEGGTRRLLVRLGAAVLVASALTYGLAAAGGNSHVVRTYPDGHSVVLTP
jgi:hypothetical protein